LREALLDASCPFHTVSRTHIMPLAMRAVGEEALTGVRHTWFNLNSTENSRQRQLKLHSEEASHRRVSSFQLQASCASSPGVLVPVCAELDLSPSRLIFSYQKRACDDDGAELLSSAPVPTQVSL
jgi:hypothetical protein